MPANLSADVIRLIDGRNFAHLATLLADGSPLIDAGRVRFLWCEVLPGVLAWRLLVVVGGLCVSVGMGGAPLRYGPCLANSDR